MAYEEKSTIGGGVRVDTGLRQALERFARSPLPALRGARLSTDFLYCQHQKWWSKLLSPSLARVLYGLLTFFRKKGLSTVWWKLGAQIAQKGRD
jgi:hypothetical protein